MISYASADLGNAGGGGGGGVRPLPCISLLVINFLSGFNVYLLHPECES